MGCCGTCNVHMSSGPVMMTKRHEVPLRQLTRWIEIILVIDVLLFSAYVIVMLQGISARASEYKNTTDTNSTGYPPDYPISQFWGIGLGTMGLAWGCIHWIMLKKSTNEAILLDQNGDVPTILSQMERWMIDGIDPAHYVEHTGFLCYLLFWAYHETPLSYPLQLTALALMIIGGVGIQAHFENNMDFQRIRQKQRITKEDFDSPARTWASIQLIEWELVLLYITYFLAFSFLFWGSNGPYITYVAVATYLIFACEFIWMVLSYLILHLEYYHRRLYYPAIMVLIRMSLYGYALWHTI